MFSEGNTPRFLGAAFLFVFAASMTAASLSTLSLLTGTMSENLVNIANNLTQMRISVVVELFTSVGIVLLAVLLFTVLHRQSKTVALVALGWWLAEAITLAISKVGAFALIPLSLEYVQAGAPDSSHLLTLGTLFLGIDRYGWRIHMLFFGLGGIVWYYLFYRSRCVPRVLAAWGLGAVSLTLINTLLTLFDPALHLGTVMYLPTFVFEPAIGLWLLIRGTSEGAEAK